MAYIKVIQNIENGNLVEAHKLIENALYQKAGAFLREKKKQVVAKTWGSQEISEAADSKSIFKASQRKAFRDKMKKLASVKKGGK